MEAKKKKGGPQRLLRKIRKYFRWPRLYLRIVRMAEDETGGMLEPC